MKADFSLAKTARALSWTAAGVMVFLPFHGLITTWASANFGHADLIKIWKEIIIALMVLPAIVLAWRTLPARHWLLHSKLAWLIWSYIALSLLFGIWAYHMDRVNSRALAYGLIINLRFLAFFVICLVLASADNFLKRNWQRILLIPAYVVIVFGFIQRFFLPYDFLKHFGYGKNTIPAYQTVDANLDFRRIGSTLRGANPLGAYLVLVITAMLGLFKKSSLRNAFYPLAAAVLFYSYSRSAWVGLLLAICAYYYLSLRAGRLKLIIKILASGAIIAVVGIWAAGANQKISDTLLHTSNSSHSRTSSNADRLNAEKQGVRDIYHQSLGRGPGTAGPASFRNGAPRIAENYFLQLGQEVGVEGLAIFIAINGLVAWQLWLRRRETLARILLASLVGISFINLVSHAWTDDSLSLIWWGLAGVALAPAILSAKRRTS